MRGEFDSLRGNKMVIWSIGLGTGLQTQLGGFDSYYHLNRRVVRDRKWLISISRMARYHYSVRMHLVCMFISGKFRNIHLPRWRNGSAFLLHGTGGGSIPSRGTKIG